MENVYLVEEREQEIKVLSQRPQIEENIRKLDEIVKWINEHERKE